MPKKQPYKYDHLLSSLKVDDQDADLLESTRWIITKFYLVFYAMKTVSLGNSKLDHILLHREIMARVLGRKLVSGEVIDHRNGDGLDNRRHNLRVASIAENNCNRRKSSTRKFKGVFADKKRWRAIISHGNKLISAGSYGTPEEAARAYDLAAIKYHGAFARLNFETPRVE